MGCLSIAHAPAAPRREALRAASATVVLSGAVLASNVVTTVVLARLTGPQGYGVYVVATSTAMLLAVPAVLGMAPLLVRTVAAGQQEQQWGRVRGAVRRAGQAVGVSSAVLMAAGAAGVVLVTDAGPTSAALLLALPMVLLVSAATVQQATMQGLGRVSLGRLPEAVVRPVLFLSLVALLASAGALTGVTAVGALVASTASALVVGAVLLRRSLPAQTRTAPPVYDDRAWVASLLPLLALNGVAVVNDRADVLLLAALHGPDAAGVFSVADRTASLTSFFLVAAAYPVSPVVARLWAAGDLATLQRVVRGTARAVTAGGLLVAVPLLVARGPVLQVFGDGFTQGRTALSVLVVGELVNVATGVVGLVLIMTGHEASVTRAVTCGAVAGLALTVVLVPSYGATGAALGTTTGVVLSNLLLTRSLWRSTGVWGAAVGGRSVR